MNTQKSRLSAIMSLIISALAIFASLEGLLNKNLYMDVYKAGSLTTFLVAGSLAQDVISVLLGILLAIISIVFLKNPNIKTLIAMLGLTSYFFYGYGLYVMQGQYTSIYLVYLAIFGLSIYSLILGLLSFERDEVKLYHLSGALRKSIAVFLMIIVFVLTPIWFLKITGDISKHIPGDTYAVFILDLCIVFPALATTAVMLLRNIPLGNVFAGIVLIKTLTICLSVAFGEWFGPIHGGFQTNYGNIAIFATLTFVSLVLLIFYTRKLKKL